MQADNNAAAYQELYELTQRKFLKQLAKFCETQILPKKYPKLFCIDLVERQKIDAMNKLKQANANKSSIDPTTVSNLPIEVSLDAGANQLGEPAEQQQQNDDAAKLELVPCLRPMCEYEEGWHLARSFVLFNELNPSWCSYLHRVMNILRNDSLLNELKLFVTDHGQRLLKEIESKSLNEERDVIESYLSLRTYFIEQLEADSIYSLDLLEQNKASEYATTLQRCELKNGKIYWLCNDHIALKNAKILTDSVKAVEVNYDQAGYQMLDEIEKVVV